MATEKREQPGFDWRQITPEDSPKTPDLREGDVAHNFRLMVFDFSTGEERATGEEFDLLERAQERPVALIFGSYT